MCISFISRAICTISVCRILFRISETVMFFLSSNVAAHTTAPSAPDHLVRLHQCIQAKIVHFGLRGVAYIKDRHSPYTRVERARLGIQRGAAVVAW